MSRLRPARRVVAVALLSGAAVCAQQLAPDRMLASLRDPDAPVRQLTWSGHVVNASGEPAVGADVWILPDGDTLLSLGHHPRERMDMPFGFMNEPPPDLFDELPLDALPHALTDATGRFELSGPWRPQRGDGDAMRVGLEQPALVVAQAGYATHVSAALPWDVDRRPPRDTVALGEVRLMPGVRMRDRIIDAWGRPLAGVAVRVLRLSPDDDSQALGASAPFALVAGLHDALTDAQGVFEIAGLHSGQVLLRVSRADRGQIDSGWLDVGGGQPRGDIDLVLPAGTTVEGVVCDADGRGIAGALVLARQVEIHGFGLGCVVRPAQAGEDALPVQLAQRLFDGALTATTDASGRFSIVGQWEGPILLYVSAPGFELARWPDVAPDARDLRLALQASATLALSWVDAESGAPISAAHVRAFRRGVAIDGRDLAWEEHAFEVPVSITAAEPAQPQRCLVDQVGPLGLDVFVAAPDYVPARFTLPGCQPGQHREQTLALTRAQPGVADDR